MNIPVEELSFRPCYGNYKGLRLHPDRPLEKFNYLLGKYNITTQYHSEMIPLIYKRETINIDFNFEYSNSYYDAPNEEENMLELQENEEIRNPEWSDSEESVDLEDN